MPHLTRHAAVAGEHLTARHHAQAEAGADVEHREVVQAVGVAVHPLAQTEGIGLLQEQACHAQPLLQIAGRIPLVEDVEIRAADDLAEALVDQAWHAHADAVHPAGDAAEQVAAVPLQRIEEGGIAILRGEPPRLRFRDLPVETRRDHAAGLCVDHHAEHGGRFRRHPHEPAGPAEALLQGIDFLDEPPPQQRVNRLRHGGSGEARDPRERGPR